MYFREERMGGDRMRRRGGLGWGSGVANWGLRMKIKDQGSKIRENKGLRIKGLKDWGLRYWGLRD